MRLLLLALAIATLVALGRNDGDHATAGIVYTWEVDDNGLSCLTPPAGASHMTIADALTVAEPGENIFVCPGTYAEDNLQLLDGNVGLFGPGFTPENDGVARVVRPAIPTSGVVLYVRGDGARVSGLEFDDTAVGVGDGPAISSRADGVIITDNTFLNNSGDAMRVDGDSDFDFRGQGLQILRNTYTNNQAAFLCFCDESFIDGNTIEGISGEGAQVSGTHNIISFNTLNGVRVTSGGDDSTVEYNTFNAAKQPNAFPLVTISGDGTSVVGNDFNNGGSGITVFSGSAMAPTHTEIILNTFNSMADGIVIRDNEPEDAFPVTAKIGGLSDLANVFINSGGGFNPTVAGQGGTNYLLELDGILGSIDAIFNNWGLCTLAEIESEIYHQPDESEIGLVDFDPFIDPGGCPTPTPIPTATPTPSATPEPTPTATLTASPTPLPSATPTGTPSAKYTQGDNDCDEDVDPVDALADLRETAGLTPLAQQEPCPDVGEEFASIWGDMDCDEDVDAVDALAIFRYIADLPPSSQNEPCPDVATLI